MSSAQQPTRAGSGEGTWCSSAAEGPLDLSVLPNLRKHEDYAGAAEGTLPSGAVAYDHVVLVSPVPEVEDARVP